MHDLKMK